MSRLIKFSLMAFWLGVVMAPFCVARNAVQPTSPGRCETNAVIFDHMRSVISEGLGRDSLVIAVARLGDGETSRELNRRRLYNLRVRWKAFGLPANRLIVAEGERVNGYGRVELYVSGKLYDTFVVRRNGDLCLACCGEDEEYYPFRGMRRRR